MKMKNRMRDVTMALVMLLVTMLSLAGDPVRVFADASATKIADTFVTGAEQIGDCNGNLVIVSESSTIPLTLSSSSLDVSGGLFSNIAVDADQGRKIVTPQGHDLYTYNIFEEIFERADGFEYHAGSYQVGGSRISANDYAEEDLSISGQEISCGSILGASENLQLSASQIQNGNVHQPTYIMAVNGDIQINTDGLNLYGLIYAPNGKVEINANRVDFRGIIIANEVVIRANSVSLNVQDIGIPVEMYGVGPEDAFTGDIMQAGSSGSSRYYYNTGGYGRDCAKYDRYKLLKTVKVGDIVYEANGGDSITPGFGITGHIAVVHKFIVHTKYIYSGESYAGSYSMRQIQLIEAIKPGGVCYSLLDDVRCDERDVTILRSNQLTDSKWEAVRYFLVKQIGKPFSFFGRWRGTEIEFLPKNTSIDTAKWYCSELAWAAYLSAGIDIEKSTGGEPGITPRDINGNDTLTRIEYK